MMSNPTTPFPLYLLPSIPFRRRSSTQSTSTISTSPSSSPPTPTSFLTPTPSANLRCNKCLAHLIPSTCIISKGFTGRHGRAYLVAPPPPSALLHPPSAPGPSSSSATGTEEIGRWKPTDLPNTLTHRPVSRQLVTGAHTVSDISCRACGSVLGWKYVHAEEEGQRYKVGKFILETRRVVRGGEWEDGVDGGGGGMEDSDLAQGRYDDHVVEHGGVGSKARGGLGEGGDGGDGEAEGEIQFDSQDEDECEDLFSGIWSPELARRRRRNRAFRRA